MKLRRPTLATPGPTPHGGGEGLPLVPQWVRKAPHVKLRCGCYDYLMDHGILLFRKVFGLVEVWCDKHEEWFAVVASGPTARPDRKNTPIPDEPLF